MPEVQEESRILRVLRLYATRVLIPEAQRIREYLEKKEQRRDDKEAARSV